MGIDRHVPKSIVQPTFRIALSESPIIRQVVDETIYDAVLVPEHILFINHGGLPYLRDKRLRNVLDLTRDARLALL